eukprot:scaffold216905_cov30-Tisochrysis_lutea.AAC.1
MTKAAPYRPIRLRKAAFVPRRLRCMRRWQYAPLIWLAASAARWARRARPSPHLSGRGHPKSCHTARRALGCSCLLHGWHRSRHLWTTEWNRSCCPCSHCTRPCHRSPSRSPGRTRKSLGRPASRLKQSDRRTQTV